MKNFNPRAPCGARPNCDGMDDLDDAFQPTRPLRGATAACDADIQPLPFQPTRPLRGATIQRSPPKNWGQDFNPRAPCGARRQSSGRGDRDGQISTHAPLAGRDRERNPALLLGKNFNPRAPCGARHGGSDNIKRQLQISTHAPLAGRDHGSERRSCCPTLFNPCAPCGARQLSALTPSIEANFNPRAPCGARPFPPRLSR